MKKFFAVMCILLTGTLFLFTGCGSSSSSGSGGKVGFSVSTLNNPFFVTLTDGAKEEAKTLGIDLTVVDAGDDSAKQTSDIEDLISKGIKVLIVNPVDSDAVAPAVQEAIDKGIKVVSVDRAVNGATVDCAIASDNVDGAKQVTEYLVSKVGKGVEVAEITGTTGASAAIDRSKGFHEIADTDLKVVASQTGNFNRAEGMSVMENLIQSNPNLKAVFAANDEMALGAIEAITASGKDIKVVGFDATDDGQKAVKDGTMLATVAQKPDEMGKQSVEIADKLIKGESVDKTIPVAVELVKGQ